MSDIQLEAGVYRISASAMKTLITVDLSDVVIKPGEDVAFQAGVQQERRRIRDIIMKYANVWTYDRYIAELFPHPPR